VAVIIGVSGCAAQFRSAWPTGVERTWVGPEYYANRLQDWRINDGRLECLESSEDKPMRVVHLLTASLHDKPGDLVMSVRTGPIEPDSEPSAESWSGFLIGAGGQHVDYRLTAFVHHRPAKDGGLVAAIDGTGRVAFRDNERGVQGGDIWTIAAKLDPKELAEIPATSRTDAGPSEKRIAELELCLVAKPTGDDYTLTLSAHDPADESRISQATLTHVDPQLVEGGVALVSHRGPIGGKLGHWFRDWTISGSKLALHPERTFGPILCTQYALSRGTLKMTTQMPPLGEQDTQTAKLHLRNADGQWQTVATSRLVAHSCTIPFRVDNWDAACDRHYRIAYDLRTGKDATQTYYWHGIIRKEPTDNGEFVVAAFTGNKHYSGGLQWNHRGIWFPHRELVAAIKHHNPDLLFFSGDQIYEGDLTGAQREPLDKALLDYHDKWRRWCWAFRDLARDRPCICIPDDHDVYHGNLWGAGGRHAEQLDDGGYCMPPEFVNMVERTQTSHLPDPYDPTPVAQGIGVYYTSLDYAGLSFAVIEDRKFKSSPTVMIPEGQVVNGWFQNVDFDSATQADVPDAVLLGERQLKFLRDWATDWSGGTWMKVLLSQTIFANVATLPESSTSDDVVPDLARLAPDEYPPDDKRVADADSNGWPQSGRNKALREMRRAFALHIAGDQHLGSFIHYGVDDWDDAGFALCVPSIANAFPRRWYPPLPGRNHKEGMPRYTGQYRDGFGNHVNVYAVSNPVIAGQEPAGLYDKAPGYGIVRFRRKSRDIVIECWPRWSDPSKPDAKQYPGWPVTINQLDNYGRQASGHLPTIQVVGMTDPVIRVIDQSNGEIVYALRVHGRSFRPRVFRPGRYTVEVGEPGTERWQRLEDLAAAPPEQPAIQVKF